MDSCIIDVDEDINRMPEGAAAEVVANWKTKIDDELKSMPAGATAEGLANWRTKIDDELKSMPDNMTEEVMTWKKRSIYKIPASIFLLNKEAYTPRAVSLGPYHHGEEHVKPMEEHKHRALLHFLKKSRKTVEPYVKALAEVVDDLKGAYDQLDCKWQQNTEAFLEMMIVDGCFTLEILRTASRDKFDYAPNDPIFSRHGKQYILPYLKRDMLMLENQLPLLVLEKLVAVENVVQTGQEAENQVIKLILEFLHQKQFKNKRAKCLHMLDAYRESLLDGEGEREDNKGRLAKRALNCIFRKLYKGREISSGDEVIRSATELKEAGIEVKRSNSKSLKAISFNYDMGVLKLPSILIDDTTESIYLNLIAFERVHVGSGNEVTSYICLMDHIIDTAKDVSLLHSCDIVRNAIGSDQAAADLFNSISKDVTLDPAGSELQKVYDDVCKYCKDPWNAWRADLVHNYLRNPWAIISVYAAIFLFVLTITQTVLSILSYVNPPS